MPPQGLLENAKANLLGIWDDLATSFHTFCKARCRAGGGEGDCVSRKGVFVHAWKNMSLLTDFPDVQNAEQG